jgi:hypothetical protein
MMIEELGARVASVWQGLRPATRSLVERALSAATPTGASAPTASRADANYDARSEWELSRLLAALDERAAERGASAPSAEQSRELARMANTCVTVLDREARSAEVFSQLLARALRARDYARVDTLADSIGRRLAPSETCELARDPHPAIRAVAHEALAQLPTTTLISLLGDPVDAETARTALECQADEYESEDARLIVNALDMADAAEEDEDL